MLLSMLAPQLSANLFRIGVFVFLAYVTFYFYIDYSHLWVKTGYGYTLFNPLILYVEIPFAIVLSALIFFPHIKNPWIRWILPIYPVLLSYFLFDQFYNYFFRAPRPSDFQNISHLFSFSAQLAWSLLLLILSIPAVITLLIYLANKNFSRQYFVYTLLVRFSLAFLVFVSLFSENFNQYHKNWFKYTVWAEEDTIRENGKLSSFIYYSNQENKNRRLLNQFSRKFSSTDIQQQLFSGKVTQARNIHLIVLESFIDPRLIRELKLKQSVLAEELLPFLHQNEKFSYVQSPIYGGGTAQAEFELLTGLKALSMVNQIEFNTLKGGRINAFVDRLSQNGYRVIATIAPSSSFFNSKLAYKSLGLSNIQFLQDENDQQGLPDNGPVFDGDLLQQNLKKIKNAFKKDDTPVFNYVLGMYGHMPFKRNKTERPDVLLTTHNDQRLNRIANQFYYRTKALAEYLNALIKLDPYAIIYVTSDHLPSIFNDEINYRLSSNKTNISLFLEHGKNIDVSGKNLYQIPWLIWDRLQGKKQSKTLNDSEMKNLYFQALSESLIQSG